METIRAAAVIGLASIAVACVVGWITVQSIACGVAAVILIGWLMMLSGTES